MTERVAFRALPQTLLERLAALGISEPTPVQERVIPEILAGRRIVFQSETGTGKTFAYLLPLLARLTEAGGEADAGGSVRILICAPTFELASQIKQAALSVSGRKAALFIGGAPIRRQIEALKERPEIVVGTPARLAELLHLKKIKACGLRAAVFDEADRLVKRELMEETLSLKQALPAAVQVVACTATADSRTKRFFCDAEVVVLPQEDVLRKSISHWAVYAEGRNKIETLRRFLLAERPQKALVFTSRADQVENISAKLSYKNIPCGALHAKSDKVRRKAAMDRFRSGKCGILVTSDLAARGLDVPGVSHIIQMDLPEDADFFVHRAGRTARAGGTGVNVLIGDAYEMERYALLEKKLGITVFPKEIRNGSIQVPLQSERIG
ncbi:MAG: DEAD/DEAH box helicase [Treponemataceae bacterium]|nr:DEAD/DEAH box helicase [Treponemataceae bacterium]